MTHAPKPLADLTRWNRAGLSRFEYIDGDAAVWLEELRIAMLGLYLRGGDTETRHADYWRDIYMRALEDWPNVDAAASRVQWERLAPSSPPQQESRGRRSERLLKQYDERTGDHAWEINRAFARAAHVLTGYLNSYANEGYLRTATQWDNLRRLAAMVNYQPTPPASAVTTVALELKEDAGAVEVEAALAVKHTPPEGGAPLIFETLAPMSGHPALNAARAEDWDRNDTPIKFGHDKVRWHLAKDQTLAIGDLAVLAGHGAVMAVALEAVDHDMEAETAVLSFTDTVPDGYKYFSTRLWTSAGDVRVGRAASKSGRVVVAVDGLGAVMKGDLIEVRIAGASRVIEVLEASGGEIVLDLDLPDADQVDLRAMSPFGLDSSGRVRKQASVSERMYAKTSGGITELPGSPVTGSDIENFYVFRFSNARSESAYTKSGDDFSSAKVRRKEIQVFPDKPAKATAGRTVTFTGKPPKGLADGDWFVARSMSNGAVKPLQVTGLRVASGEYHVEFHSELGTAPDRTEFHGPMARAFRPVGHDRNSKKAFIGNKVVLQDIPDAARALIRPGRLVIIRKQTENTDTAVLAKVDDSKPLSDDRLELALLDYEAAKNWAKGDLTFALNTVQVSHGESKGSKLLGSGDGERSAQVFELKVKNVSHIPSTAAESGVVPAIDVAVNGQRWEYRDFIDPAAEGTQAWSSTLTDSGTLMIHFRRRLVTGLNNVVVTRHRVGAGAAGSGIPPLSFDKPMKKHRHVAAIVQPFATAGGADREPVAKLRQSGPQRLSTNGRAVSLKDFENLAIRNASILHAHASMTPMAGAQRMVELTVALAGGGSVAGLAGDVAPSIMARALPGIGVSFRDYEHLPLHVSVKVRADLSVVNRTDIKAAAEARLAQVFAIERRDFGQTAYVSEVLAALETVDGVENALVGGFDLGPEYDLTQPKPSGFSRPWPRHVAINDGKVAAIYATEHQIIHIGAMTAIAVVVEDTR